MKIILIVVLLRIYFAESRVFCQDSYASPWMALGYSCPINCANVVTAVKRLKTIDYKIMFKKKLRHQRNFSNTRSNSEIYLKSYNFHPPRRKFNFIQSKSVRNVDKIMADKTLISRLKIAFNMAANESRIKCPPKVTDGGKPRNVSNCRRMYDHDEFLKKFTNLLNKYTHSEYQFTEEMTSIILEKILGTNMDLRHGIFDIKRMLAYFSKAIRYHRGHTKQNFVIKLKSRHCLTISIPGCYCKSGFVENSGQCVKPSDCLGNHDKDYLARIIVY